MRGRMLTLIATANQLVCGRQSENDAIVRINREAYQEFGALRPAATT